MRLNPYQTYLPQGTFGGYQPTRVEEQNRLLAYEQAQRAQQRQDWLNQNQASLAAANERTRWQEMQDSARPGSVGLPQPGMPNGQLVKPPETEQMGTMGLEYLPGACAGDVGLRSVLPTERMTGGWQPDVGPPEVNPDRVSPVRFSLLDDGQNANIVLATNKAPKPPTPQPMSSVVRDGHVDLESGLLDVPGARRQQEQPQGI